MVPGAGNGLRGKALIATALAACRPGAGWVDLTVCARHQNLETGTCRPSKAPPSSSPSPWAASLKYEGIQVSTNDPAIFDLEKAAASQD
ncbi:hypothetical protein [Novosphingobium sp. BW1]|uniref:hypothetical protein n=1 Tax=Novosphingobium sp. BW1 TaxID=2592621 RepID=UPI00352CFF2B